MAVTVVVADNNRLTQANDLSEGGSWTSPGGGAAAGVEVDVFFQGLAGIGSAVSRKISTAGRGFYFSPTTAVDHTQSNRQCVIFKINITNPGASPTIAAGGISIFAGSNENDNYGLVYFGSDAYPVKAGWVILPLDPGAAWLTSNGTPPALTAIGAYGIQVNAAFAAAAKAENVVIDAIDVGKGININGGTGADPSATFADMVDFDQGTLTNRFGYITEVDTIISALGKIGIGYSVTPAIANTRFEDSRRIINFPDGLYSEGYCGVDIHTGTGSTTSEIVLSDCTFIGISTGGGVENTKPDLLMDGNTGFCTITRCSFTKFCKVSELDNAIDLTIDGSTFDQIQRYEHRNGVLTNNNFNISSLNGSNVGMLSAFNSINSISNNTFTTPGTSGHAINILTSGTYSFIGNKFEGFQGTTGSNLVENSGDANAAILNSSGGLVTLNISGGGDEPSIRNVGTGSTTIVNANVTVNINGLPNTVGAASSTEIRVFDNSQINPTLGFSTTEFVGVGTENHTTSTYTFSVGAGATFDIRVFNVDYVPLLIVNQTANTDPTNIPVDLKIDRVYDDDSPPTGE